MIHIKKDGSKKSIEGKRGSGKEIAKELNEHVEWKSILIEPVQRIARYELLLVNLKKKTPVDHPDYQLLDDAISRFKKINANLEQDAARQQEVSKVREIEKLLGGNLSLVNSSRSLILDSIVSCRIYEDIDYQTAKIKQDYDRCRVFLFSDIFILAQLKNADIINGYKKYPLNANVILQASDDSLNYFTLKFGPTYIKVHFETQELASQWQNEIQMILKSFFVSNDEDFELSEVSVSLRSSSPVSETNSNKELVNIQVYDLKE
jgi:hypothetical protein